MYVWQINRQGNRKHILLWLYNLNDFLFLSHPSLFVLVCFVYSLEIYLKLTGSSFSPTWKNHPPLVDSPTKFLFLPHYKSIFHH